MVADTEVCMKYKDILNGQGTTKIHDEMVAEMAKEQKKRQKAMEQWLKDMDKFEKKSRKTQIKNIK